jgi:hypothetical protein
MPRNIVDLSARSRIIRDEPWHLHFWESTPNEILDFLRKPREQLREMGIEIPEDCRIETVIENHDWMAARTGGLAADNGPIIVCNVGGGDIARGVYRVSMYAHEEGDVGKYEKRLLHDPHEEAVGGPRAA